MTGSRVHPPTVADEVTGLRSWLAFHRATLAGKTAGLTTEQLRTTHPPSTLTLGGLLKHLAYVEDNWFGVVLLGREPVEPWASADWQADRDWELSSAADDTAEQLRALWERSVAASETILDAVLADPAGGGLDRLSARDLHGAGPCDLRWILVHLVEEYARHNGHADLLREAVDGETGV
jgi:uncharacterized damage-inducible protein DinB